MKINEIDARAACLADGLNPDKLIKGRPAWKLYTQAETGKPEPSELPPEALGIFTRIADIHTQMARLEREAEREAEALNKLISGKMMRHHGAIYKVERIYSHYLGKIDGRGRRVTADGKLGTKSWNLNSITTADFA